MQNIFVSALAVFVIQLIFIGTRTWNVKAISQGRVGAALLSGAIIHLSWLLSLFIGVDSAEQVVVNGSWKHTIVVFASLSGGLLGTYVGMIKKKPV